MSKEKDKPNSDNSDDLTNEEELRAENEIAALKLDLKYGGMSHISPDAPPELVQQWLENIDLFEEKYQNVAEITICEFIGNPEMSSIDESKDGDVLEAIHQLEKVLEDHSIFIERPEHLTDRGWYRFLSIDLLHQQIKDVKSDGYVQTFIYSEFYQDELEFAGVHTQEVIEDILDLTKPYQAIWLSDECRNQSDSITKSEVIETIQKFRLNYKEIDPIAFSVFKVEPIDRAVYVSFGIEWEGIDGVSGEKEHFEGPGLCQLNLINRQWLVEGLFFPGFEF